jgi:hypothetical protein
MLLPRNQFVSCFDVLDDSTALRPISRIKTAVLCVGPPRFTVVWCYVWILEVPFWFL